MSFLCSRKERTKESAPRPRTPPPGPAPPRQFLQGFGTDSSAYRAVRGRAFLFTPHGRGPPQSKFFVSAERVPVVSVSQQGPSVEPFHPRPQEKKRDRLFRAGCYLRDRGFKTSWPAGGDTKWPAGKQPALVFTNIDRIHFICILYITFPRSIASSHSRKGFIGHAIASGGGETIAAHFARTCEESVSRFHPSFAGDSCRTQRRSSRTWSGD